MKRLFHAARHEDLASERAAIFAAFFDVANPETAEGRALLQGVQPDAHLRAKPAEPEVQAAYDAERLDDPHGDPLEIPGTHKFGHFVGPNGRVYEISDDVVDRSGALGLAQEFEPWLRRDLNEAIAESGTTSEQFHRGLELQIEAGISAAGGGSRRGGRRARVQSSANPFAGPEREIPKLEGTSTRLGQRDRSHGHRPVFQTSRNSERLRAQAERNAPQLRSFLTELVKPIPGAQFGAVRVKTWSRIREKLGRNVMPHEVPDYLGGRIVVDRPSGMRSVLRALQKHAKVVRTQDNTQKPQSTGYRAIHVQVLGPKGFTAEVQIQPRPIFELDQVTHAPFERYQKLRQSTREADRIEAKAIIKRLRKLHDEAWNRFVTGN
ncbi:MAG: hypothetical protein QNJ92_14530 [Alphaproteobacteria bacterium]|nr:hypothetical protein [Alphaproteobacteria bacterium]